MNNQTFAHLVPCIMPNPLRFSWIRSLLESASTHQEYVSYNDMQYYLPQEKIEGVPVFRDMYDLHPEFFQRDVTQVVCSEYLPPLSHDHDTILVRSAMGTGKTHVMSNWVREELDLSSSSSSPSYVFFVVPRISMADRILGALRSSGVEAADYRDPEYRTLQFCLQNGHKCFVLCFESWVKFMFGSDIMLNDQENLAQFPEYCTLLNFIDHPPNSILHMQKNLRKVISSSILVLDESESMIPHVMTSTTFSKIQKLSLYLMYTFVEGARKVLVMDAGLGISTVDLVASRRKREIHTPVFIMNTFCPKKKMLYVSSVFTDKDVLTKQIIWSIKSGGNVFITSDSKRVIDELEFNILLHCGEHTSILKYTSDSNAELRKGLSCPNQHWNRVQVVLCSPTVVFGTDFSNDRHFSAQFHFFTGRTISPSACFQQMGRVRLTLSMCVYIHLCECPYDGNPDVDNLHQFLTTASVVLNSKFANGGIQTFAEDYLVNKKRASEQPAGREIVDGSVLLKDLTYRLFLWTYHEQYHQANRLMRILVDMAKNLDYEVFVGFPYIAGQDTVRLEKTVKYVAKYKKNPVPLPNTFAASGPVFDSHDCAETHLAVKAFKDQDNQRERSIAYSLQMELGFVNMAGWGNEDVRRPKFAGSVHAAERVLKNFALILRDPDHILEDIRRKQKIRSYLAPMLDTAPSHFALCMISFFWPNPLLCACNEEMRVVKWSVDEDSILVNDYMQVLLDEMWFHSFNCRTVVSPRRRLVNKALAGLLPGGHWTRLQTAQLMKYVVESVLNITVSVRASYANANRTQHKAWCKTRFVDFCLEERDSVLECLWAQHVNHPKKEGEELVPGEILQNALSSSRAQFQWSTFTKIDSNPYSPLHVDMEYEQAMVLVTQETIAMSEAISSVCESGDDVESCAFLLCLDETDETMSNI